MLTKETVLQLCLRMFQLGLRCHRIQTKQVMVTKKINYCKYPHDGNLVAHRAGAAKPGLRRGFLPRY